MHIEGYHHRDKGGRHLHVPTPQERTKYVVFRVRQAVSFVAGTIVTVATVINAPHYSLDIIEFIHASLIG